jgi:hypothetical protein
MKYPDGTDVRVGDRVRLDNPGCGPGEFGTIVFCADTNEYTEDFPKYEWGHLDEGVMIKTDNGALLLVYDFDPDEHIYRVCDQ